ncbi:hypothetical protein HRbin17_02178 [bacterium HR17]|uniref:Uncharacterized protein n=1 Tax=Candidatus Fervidibacter japonicus TaxID=2035412 RepID=A0A2H5XEN5_9BACT|nr:hypothetical protein HRbin17_02178 [bacterium HR17]
MRQFLFGGSGEPPSEQTFNLRRARFLTRRLVFGGSGEPPSE